MFFCKITVSFRQLSNFFALMSVMKQDIETAFLYVESNASVTWLIRTDYAVDEPFESLENDGIIKLKWFEESAQADALLGGTKWVKGLAQSK